MTLIPQNCQICGCADWEYIGTLTTGVWDKSKADLTRNELLLPLGKCDSCGHVQMTIQYTKELFELLYFTDVSPPSIFFTNGNPVMFKIYKNDSEMVRYQYFLHFLSFVFKTLKVSIRYW